MDEPLAFVIAQIEGFAEMPLVRPALSPGARTRIKRTRKSAGCDGAALERLRAFADGHLDPAVAELLAKSDGVDLLIDDDHGGGFRLRSVDEILSATETLRVREGMPSSWLAVAGPTHDPEHVIVDCAPGSGQVRYASNYDPMKWWWVADMGYADFLAQLLARDGDLYWWEAKG